MAAPFFAHYLYNKPSRQAEQAYEQGVSYFGAHDYDLADAAFTRALDEHPKYADALFFRARSRASARNWPGSISDLTALSEVEDSTRRSTLAGFVYFELRDFPQAEVELNHALQLSPNDPKALFTHAQYFAWRHDYGRAISDLQRLLTIAPTSEKTLFMIAGAYSRLGDTDKAALKCRQLIRINRKKAQYPELCGIIAHRGQDFETAVRFYDNALKLAPGTVSVVENRERAKRGEAPLSSDASASAI